MYLIVFENGIYTIILSNFTMSKKINYKGWELNFFDQAQNFRDYQWSLFKNKIKNEVLEVGPGNCVFLHRYNSKSKKFIYTNHQIKLEIELKKSLNQLKK